jgi:hypothetical protein
VGNMGGNRKTFRTEQAVGRRQQEGGVARVDRTVEGKLDRGRLPNRIRGQAFRCAKARKKRQACQQSDKRADRRANCRANCRTNCQTNCNGRIYAHGLHRKAGHQLPRRVCLFRDARRRSRVLCRIKSEWLMTVSILSSVVHHVPDRGAGRGRWVARRACRNRPQRSIIRRPACVAKEFFGIAAKRASPLTRWPPASANFGG